jgi:hypothetical protein
MAESRELERAISKDVDGGEMWAYGEEKKTPLAYLDMMTEGSRMCGYATHVFECLQSGCSRTEGDRSLVCICGCLLWRMTSPVLGRKPWNACGE